MVRGLLLRLTGSRSNSLPAQRTMASGFTIALNLLVLWIVVLNLRPHAPVVTLPVFSITIFGSTSAAQQVPPEPALVKPSDTLAAIPDIEVDASTQTASAHELAVQGSQILAPRPDPKHINALPAVPAAFAKPGADVTLILRVYIQADGAVTDAQIARSSGDARLDQFVASYVKANWRYLPALASGVAISDWTTILVPFRPS